MSLQAFESWYSMVSLKGRELVRVLGRMTAHRPLGLHDLWLWDTGFSVPLAVPKVIFLAVLSKIGPGIILWVEEC